MAGGTGKLAGTQPRRIDSVPSFGRALHPGLFRPYKHRRPPSDRGSRSGPLLRLRPALGLWARRRLLFAGRYPRQFRRSSREPGLGGAPVRPRTLTGPEILRCSANSVPRVSLPGLPRHGLGGRAQAHARRRSLRQDQQGPALLRGGPGRTSHQLSFGFG